MDRCAMKTGLVIGLGDPLHGDEGFGWCVLEALSNEPWEKSVELIHLGDDPRWAGGLIHGADLMIVIDALHLGGPAGRLHAWSASVFERNMVWMIHEYRRIELLAEAMARADLAGGLPKERFFLWMEAQGTEGYGISPAARKAVWRAARAVKEKLVRGDLLPESALAVTPMGRFTPMETAA